MSAPVFPSQPTSEPVRQHTPTPWRLCTTGNLGSAIEAPSGKKYSDLDDGFRIVASYQECCASDLYDELEANRLANGAFIVEAVNSFEVMKRRIAVLEQVIAEDLSPFDCRDDLNKMIVEDILKVRGETI
jgi:hypothetical protein